MIIQASIEPLVEIPTGEDWRKEDPCLERKREQRLLFIWLAFGKEECLAPFEKLFKGLQETISGLRTEIDSIKE